MTEPGAAGAPRAVCTAEPTAADVRAACWWSFVHRSERTPSTLAMAAVVLLGLDAIYLAIALALRQSLAAPLGLLGVEVASVGVYLWIMLEQQPRMFLASLRALGATRYAFDAEGVEIETPAARRSLRWKDLRGWVPLRSATLLVPEGEPSFFVIPHRAFDPEARAAFGALLRERSAHARSVE